MIFNLHGMVMFRGKKLTNDIHGKYETKDEAVIQRLTELGYKPVMAPGITQPQPVPLVAIETEPRKLGRPKGKK